MGYVVKIETKHGSDFAEKTTRLEKTEDFEFGSTEKRRIVEKMIKILKKKGLKQNWMTGLDADKTILEQYSDVIDKDLTRDEFNFFRTLVPKGEYGTTSIISLILAQEADWYNRLVD